MPQNKNSPEPPVMNWGAAMPILVAAGLLDLIRAFFEFFWFFGPAVAGLYCTLKVQGVVTAYSLGLLGTKTAAALCAGGVIAGGAAISEFTTPFGMIMADAVGLAAFLLLGFWLIRRNPRMFTVNKSTWLWLAGSLGVSVVPFIGTFPSFFVVLRILYRRQIKIEKAAHARWKKENTDAQLQERNRRAALLMQNRAAQEEAVADAASIPDELLETA